MSERDWNAHYAADELPWDTGEPDAHLIELIDAGTVPAQRALEVGCGTGSNAIWLASRGFEVVATDVAPLAIERARARAAEAGVGDRCRFEVSDFLVQAPAGPFGLVFDRGVFHVFDQAHERAVFATHVARSLGDGGVWLSLIGSTEGPPRDFGPPRRSARDITTAIEPVLEILELQAINFETVHDSEPRAWRCLARRRTTPAQPSTGS